LRASHLPNPAHAQFISRESSDPVDETRALSETRARQLMGMTAGDSLLETGDRAILNFYLYTGARIETGCKLNVSDFHQDGDEATCSAPFFAQSDPACRIMSTTHRENDLAHLG
jgi:hypothetical protein